MASMAGDKAGKFILRVALGVIVLLHGIAKLKGGIDPITGMVTAQGLPAFVAYGVYVGEVIAPLMVSFGFHARTGAALIVVNMVFAIALAHLPDLGRLGQGGGWALELQAFFLFTAAAVALLGPGRYSINRR